MSEPKKAKFPMICWKRFRVHHSFKRCLVSPFYNQLVVSKIYKADYLDKICALGDIIKREDTYGIINHGIHTYRKRKFCKNMAFYREIFLLCIIPRGTLYYESTDKTQYCSEKIKIIDPRRKKFGIK